MALRGVGSLFGALRKTNGRCSEQNGGEADHRKHLTAKLVESRPFHHDAANDGHVVPKRVGIGEFLDGDRHVLDRDEETGRQDRKYREKPCEKHRLLLGGGHHVLKKKR